MRIAGALLLGTVVMSLHALAQQKTETTVYKVEFNIHDGSDLRAKAGRRYTILVLNNSKSVFKVGDRVPYSTGNALYTYLDTGVNIDCFAREVGDKLAMHAELDLSGVAPPEKRPPTSTPNPTVLQTKFVVDTVLNPGKPSVVASLDDPVSGRKFDVEATASKVN